MKATTMVTLDEVLRAAGNRRAALAPETSGYLALAIGDATSRLPLGIDDRAVALTTEGTVLVPRKGDLVAPADAARTLREALARLLAVSAGSMPGLAAAAKPRAEADVEGVVASIEGALIPVNRSAARRALARLARETLRAKNAGKLGAVRAVAPIPQASQPIAALAPVSAPAEAAERNAPAVYLTGMGVEILVESIPTPAPQPLIPEVETEIDSVVSIAATSTTATENITTTANADDAIAAEDDVEIPPSRETTPTLMGVGDVGVYITAALSPAPTLVRDVPLFVEPSALAAREYEPAPSSRRTMAGVGIARSAVEEAEDAASIAGDLGDVPAARATTFDEDDDAITNALPVVQAKAGAKTPLTITAAAIAPAPIAIAPLTIRRAGARPKPGEASLAPSVSSDVDDLLSRFNVAGMRDDHRIAQSLKLYAGLDLTVMPPIIWESPRPGPTLEPAPPSSLGWEASPPPPATRTGRAARFGFRISAAILAVCVLGTSMLWRLRPDLFGGWSAPHNAPGKVAPPSPPGAPPQDPHADFDP